MSNQQSQQSGNSLFLLFLVFLVLKLTHVVDWSWWLVSAPLWLPFALLGTAVLVIGLVALLTAVWQTVFGSGPGRR